MDGLLAAQPFAVDVCFAASCDVQELESGTLPKVVAAVDELVDASVKTTFF